MNSAEIIQVLWLKDERITKCFFWDDESCTQSRKLVSDIIAAMPNRVYARILEEVVLEGGQYKGKEKIELLHRKTEEFGIPLITCTLRYLWQKSSSNRLH